MRKSNLLFAIVAALLVLAWAGSASAQSCAVGGFVTGKSKGMVQQLLAFSTNATFFITYAGAITSGTSDCSNSGIVKEEYEQEVFVAAAYDGLLQDMAMGEGTYLSAFGELMGCDGALRGDFAQWGQANLERLSADGTSPAVFVNEVRQGLAADPRLSACTRLS